MKEIDIILVTDRFQAVASKGAWKVMFRFSNSQYDSLVPNLQEEFFLWNAVTDEALAPLSAREAAVTVASNLNEGVKVPLKGQPKAFRYWFSLAPSVNGFTATIELIIRYDEYGFESEWKPTYWVVLPGGFAVDATDEQDAIALATSLGERECRKLQEIFSPNAQGRDPHPSPTGSRPSYRS